MFASGLEQLALQDRQAYEEAVDLLNRHREDIRDTNTTVVLWLSSAAHRDLLQYAPDFTDWRTVDVTFDLAEGQNVPRTDLAKLSLTEAENLRHHERRLMEMLACPNLEPVYVAEFNKKLAQVRRQLGKIEASEEALAESARASIELRDYARLEELYCRQIIDRYGKLTLYSVTSDASLAVDLERVFVKLTATQQKIRLPIDVPRSHLAPARVRKRSQAAARQPLRGVPHPRLRCRGDGGVRAALV